MRLGRRAFLERVLSALAGIACSQALSLRYAQVLAQPTQRKLALLVGINQYRAAGSDSGPLLGCLTDVALQRELLIHRFGFASSDILTLTDQQASRTAVEAAFRQHLIGQAQPGDVVVFHFSGYGSRLKAPTTASNTVPSAAPNTASEAQSAQTDKAGQETLVLADPVVLDDSAEADLPADTLLLLLRSLATDQVTTVLDTCYTDPVGGLLSGALLGQLRVRSRPGRRLALPASELDLQAQLQASLGLEANQLAVQRRAGQVPGVVLSAASPSALALDGLWQGYSAGLFTRSLTQQLWQMTPATTLRIVLSHSKAMARSQSQQEQPQLQGQKSSQSALAAYFSPPTQNPIGAGAVIAVEDGGRGGQLWLGGLPPAVLEAYAPGSVLTVAGTSPDVLPRPDPLQVQVRARNGLSAQVRVLEVGANESSSSLQDKSLQVGQHLHEQVRVLPRNLNLVVALDPALSRIERVDATSALSTLAQVQAVQAGEQAADCLFSQLRAADQAALTTRSMTGPDLPTVGSYGLFSLGRDPIPESFGESGESVGSAIRRLGHRLQNLLALKLLRLLNNGNSSQMEVAATLALADPGRAGESGSVPRQLAGRSTRPWDQTEQLQASKAGLPTAGLPAAGLLELPVGSSLKMQLSNHDNQPLYGCIVALSPNSKGSIRFPTSVDPGTEADNQKDWGLLASQGSRTVPHATEPIPWIVREPRGLVEVAVIFSRAPFKQVRQNLGQAARQTGAAQTVAQEMLTLRNPLSLMRGLLLDLEQASPRPSGLADDLLALDVNHWAGLMFTTQIV
ncbi:caspase family protein [Leptolyngbya sp. FACHB-261]|uniref:caspase family protein n=1 Tax=Leptolyngbya sp. FACHB-261 TaxID=2692806 RepID=UPI0016824CA3|nr:caspase family protein [Leptolyngbya sp. FACHB-261]MBD2103251.1 caspase family protein [Leptolyngbya sp. FACHB-261]